MKKAHALGFASMVLVFSKLATAATTYYVAPGGDDSNPGTESAPVKTLAHGASLLKPGDTLLARTGTYVEEFYNGIPGGTSWSAPVTLAAYPGEKPVIQPAAGAARVFTFASAELVYIEVRGFVLDAKNVTNDAVKVTWGSSSGASHHIRLKSCEIMNSPGQGILVGGESGKNGLDVTANEFIDLDVHDNGTTDFDHGFYITSVANLVEGCRAHANAGWGIHVYNGSNQDADQNIIRNNRSYDNARVGDRGVGIGVYSGTGTLVYNNLIWGNKDGIAVNYGATDAGIYNNVVYANVGSGISIGQEATGTIVRNNVIWQTGTAFSDAGTGTVNDTNSIDVDPGVVDATAHDFHPTASSPLVDKGATISEVTSDFDGVTRPQGSAYDIGAYEYCATSCGAAGQSGSGGSAGTTGSGGTGTGGASGGTTSSGGGGGSTGATGGTGGKKSGSSEDDGGCGCRLASDRPPSSLWLLSFALILLGRRSARRPTLT